MRVLTFSPGPLRMPLARTTVFSRCKEINQTLILVKRTGGCNYSNVTQINKLLIDIDPQDFPRKSSYYRLHAILACEILGTLQYTPEQREELED